MFKNMCKASHSNKETKKRNRYLTAKSFTTKYGNIGRTKEKTTRAQSAVVKKFRRFFNRRTRDGFFAIVSGGSLKSVLGNHLKKRYVIYERFLVIPVYHNFMLGNYFAIFDKKAIIEVFENETCKELCIEVPNDFLIYSNLDQIIGLKTDEGMPEIELVYALRAIKHITFLYS